MIKRQAGKWINHLKILTFSNPLQHKKLLLNIIDRFRVTRNLNKPIKDFKKSRLI